MDKENIDSTNIVEAKSQGHKFEGHCVRSRLLSRLGLPATKELDSICRSDSKKPDLHQTLILFDWDDTLLCTFHLYQASNPPSSADMDLLDIEASKLLMLATSLGRTVIVTNALRVWVQDSAKKHLPRVHALLNRHDQSCPASLESCAEQVGRCSGQPSHKSSFGKQCCCVDRIAIVSARDCFEHLYPGEPSLWKKEAFCAIKEDSRLIANLTAVGDSEAEMSAIRELAKLYSVAFIKAVKLREEPTCKELRKELAFLQDKLTKLVTSARCFSIKIGHR